MRFSTDRILTTHTGSLPRPDSLAGTNLLDPAAPPATEAQIRDAVVAIVRSQRDSGVDVVNDGEVSKRGYSTYVTERLEGFGGEGRMAAPRDYEDFPGWAARVASSLDAVVHNRACVGPVSYRDTTGVGRDIDNLKAATASAEPADVFMTAASPGVIELFQENQYYRSDEDYIMALADAMKTEYDAIAGAGLVLQLDCPDLAAGHSMAGSDETDEEFLRKVSQRVGAINHATRDIPADQMRLHLCWGNYEGPHHRDIPISKIISTVLTARPAALSFEAANPRHEHEYLVFDDVKLPDGKVLIPGVLDSTTNYIEHPELVAQRIQRYAQRVGRQNVLAGTDCGFATFANFITSIPASPGEVQGDGRRCRARLPAAVVDGGLIESRYRQLQGRHLAGDAAAEQRRQEAQHQRRPGQVGDHRGLDAAGGAALEAEQGAHHPGGEHQSGIAGGERGQRVHGGGRRDRMLVAGGGVERAAEEDLLRDAVSQRRQQDQRCGALVGEGQHGGDGAVQDRNVPRHQGAAEEHAETGDPG